MIVALGAVVVVEFDDPAEAVAITGGAGEPVGAVLTMPVAAVLFGYGVQVSVRVLPDTFNDREMAGSTVRLMAPPVAVKGPTVPGVDGRLSNRPEAGTGLGMATLMAIEPLEIVAGWRRWRPPSGSGGSRRWPSCRGPGPQRQWSWEEPRSSNSRSG